MTYLRKYQCVRGCNHQWLDWIDLRVVLRSKCQAQGGMDKTKIVSENINKINTHIFHLYLWFSIKLRKRNRKWKNKAFMW